MAGIPSDTSTLTTAEIDAVLRATAAPSMLKKDPSKRVAFVGNVATPTLNAFMQMGKVNGVPLRGAFRAFLSTPRNGAFQPVSGRDILNYESIETLEDVDYRYGEGHMGDEWVHQQIELATGMAIDRQATVNGSLDISKKGWWKRGGEALGKMVDLAKTKHDAFQLDMRQQLNKYFWRANTSTAKLWVGLDSLISTSSNTTGPVGNRDRASSPYLRHRLFTGVAADDLELAVSQIMRDCAKNLQDGTSLNYSCCGYDVYDILLTKLMLGDSAISKTFDRNWAEDKAQEMAGKIKIGIPQNAIYVRGIGIVTPEPVFEELQKEDLATPDWNKRWYFFNMDHIAFKWSAEKDPDKTIVHPSPSYQKVTRMEKNVGACLAASRLDVHGAIVISGS